MKLYRMRRISKFIQLSFREKILFAEALLMHLWAGLLLKLVPFRRIPHLFGSRQFETPIEEENQSRHNVSGQQSVCSQQSGTIYFIREAIARAGRVSPWKNRCLVSSLAARCMLNRRKIQSVLYLGVSKKPDGQTVAHSWLKAGKDEIVEMNGEYTELYTF